jgi:hypothetical protein
MRHLTRDDRKRNVVVVVSVVAAVAISVLAFAMSVS